MVGEYAQRQEIGRLFDKNCIAWPGKKGTDEMQPHRSAVGDEQAVWFHRIKISTAQECCQRLPESSIALFSPILEEFTVVLAKTFFRSLA